MRYKKDLLSDRILILLLNQISIWMSDWMIGRNKIFPSELTRKFAPSLIHIGLSLKESFEQPFRWDSGSMTPESPESQVSWVALCMSMRKRNRDSVADKGGFGAVLASSKKSTKHGITNGDSPSVRVEITSPCCRRSCL